MIELRKVCKGYQTPGGFHSVLEDLNVKIPMGENLGILGGNGAGKSTLLRILSGIEAPDSGRIAWGGHRISWPIGFAGGFSGSLTAEENCRFVARIYDADVDEVVDFVQEFADVGKYFYMPVKTYSSGMRARVAFGLSMAIDFDYYLVDEVTAVGDKKFQTRCREAFAERQEKSTVIIVSHQMNTMKDYCKKYALLNAGKLTIYDDFEAARAIYES